MRTAPTTPWRRAVALGIGLVAATMAVAACGGSGGSGASGDKVTITLSGPNQWNSSGSSFGKPWEDLVAAFEAKEPNIKVKTVVLPLNSFGQTISTQLAAGTAPELVFNQAPHKPEMVVSLDEYLKKPNPYVEGNKQWIDVFRKKFYGFGNGNSRNAAGNIEFVPFNLVGIGLFTNNEAFQKAGVQLPFKDYEDMIAGCGKLKSAGYTPLAMDASNLGAGWTMATISGMLLDKRAEQYNVYAPDGSAGKAPTVTAKGVARAVLSGEFSSRTPEVTESLNLLKRLWDECVDKNWSGVTGDNGAVIGLRDFAAGKAAMAWGVNFGVSALADVPFKVGSTPFPKITATSSPLATGAPARFGASPGGTSYMIPSATKGAKLDAAVKFLQFVSAPDKIQPWLAATGGIPAVEGAKGADQTKAFAEGSWGEAIPFALPGPPPSVTQLSLWDGWLLGSRSLDKELNYLQDMWTKAQQQAVADNKWQSEPWAKK
ncbi:MAG: multiple sugar transport system substrate-binding protein [Kribbellaceae bacterium]|nr:multiple sugar transport system substrate-binding protein [Kribbellaceae bacterium]